MLGKMLIFNLISNNTVCNTNTTTNANEIKALTRIESENFSYSGLIFKEFIYLSMSIEFTSQFTISVMMD